MTNTERVKAILHYQDYDRLPVVHFSFWDETLEKWRDEGHITAQETQDTIKDRDGSAAEKCVADKLGFDFNWYNCFCPNARLFPEAFYSDSLQAPNTYAVDEMASSIHRLFIERPYATGCNVD